MKLWRAITIVGAVCCLVTAVIEWRKGADWPTCVMWIVCASWTLHRCPECR